MYFTPVLHVFSTFFLQGHRSAGGGTAIGVVGVVVVVVESGTVTVVESFLQEARVRSKRAIERLFKK